MVIGVIGGSNLHKTFLFEGAQKKKVETKYGSAEIYYSGDILFIPRHGSGMNIPPHMINHHANITALRGLGVEKVIGLCMTGSLRKAIKPGSLVIPHDYLSLCGIPTFFKDSLIHITPELDEGLRSEIINAARKSGIKIVQKGVYVQTCGPRLETKSEISMLKNYGDVIGMTMASEATLADEAGLSYASICTVENYAHGLSKDRLDFRNIAKEGVKHSIKELSLLTKVMEGLS